MVLAVSFLQVSLYVYIFYESKLYSDMILHVIYIFLAIWGWYSWKYGGEEKNELEITKIQNWIAPILIVIAGTTLWGYAMDSQTDATLPYPDAFTTSASLVAQYLMIQKKLGSWIFWIIVDIAAIFIYYSKALYPTSILYIVFLIMASIGFFNWKKLYKG